MDGPTFSLVDSTARGAVFMRYNYVTFIYKVKVLNTLTLSNINRFSKFFNIDCAIFGATL